MRTENSCYDDDFFDTAEARIKSSAETIVPIIIHLFNPMSVIDVGCGRGVWLSVCRKYDIDVFGIDGDYINKDNLAIPKANFVEKNLALDVDFDRRFDLALCLEVAEHLPMERSESFIDFLVSLAPVVVFSAAIPGQTGRNHINEQWPEFWIDIFKKKNYDFFDLFRPILWNIEKISPWYRQNMLVFIDNDTAMSYGQIYLDTQKIPINLVHPEIFSIVLAGRNRSIEERDALLKEQSDLINSLYVDLDVKNEYVSYLENSFSWQITKPLRKIKHISNFFLAYLHEIRHLWNRD